MRNFSYYSGNFYSHKFKGWKIYGGKPIRGVLFAFGSSLCQAVGILLAKEGLNAGMGALSGTVIRMIFATIVMVIFILSLNLFSENHTIQWILRIHFLFLAQLLVPILEFFSLCMPYQRQKFGIASALMTVSPILLIPLSYYFLEDRVKKASSLEQ